MKEWKKVFDNYEISNCGELRNIKTGKILHQFISHSGYYICQVAGKTRAVHRIVAKAFCVPIEGKDFVNHIDGNKLNNSADNLEWCTRKENQIHAAKHHLLKPTRGEQNGRCKLKLADVKFILDNFVSGDKRLGTIGLGKRFNVSRQTISAVVHGQNWGYVAENGR